MEKTAIDKFMMFLPIIIVILIAIVVIVRFIRKKYKPTSEIISFKEFKTYYGQSLKLIWSNRIILYIPIIMISVVIILGVIAGIKHYIYLLEINFEPDSIKLLDLGIYNVINSAFSSLDYGILRVFTSNYLFILLSAILIFFYPKFWTLLRENKLRKRFPEYHLFKRVIIMNLFIAVYFSMFFTLLQKNYQTMAPGILKDFLSLSNNMLMLFFILSTYSFLSSIFIQIILDKNNKLKRDRAEYLQIAINKFPRMFSFHILLALIIPFIISLPGIFFDNINSVIYILNTLSHLVWLLFLSVPFLIMNSTIKFSEVLEKNLTLLFRNFRMALFILTGLIGGAILYLVTNIITNLWGYLLLSSVMNSFSHLFKIAYSMIFIVAFFIFLKDEVGKE